MKAISLISLSWLICLSSGFVLVPTFRNHAAPPRQRLPMKRIAPMAMVNDSVPPRLLVSQGMDAFRRGDIQGSIDLFDRADANAPELTPYLWQRGLSLYYADRFKEASKQVFSSVITLRDAISCFWLFLTVIFVCRSCKVSY